MIRRLLRQAIHGSSSVLATLERNTRTPATTLVPTQSNCLPSAGSVPRRIVPEVPTLALEAIE
jgi:hypothetical protein